MAVVGGLAQRGSPPAARTVQHAGARHRLRGERQPGRLSHHPAPRVSRRRARVGRRGAAAGDGRTSRAGAVPARLRADEISRCDRATHGRAGGDRPGSDRLRRRAAVSTIRRRRLRLGRPRRGHRRGAASRSRARGRARRRLHRFRTSSRRRGPPRRRSKRRSGISGTSTPSADAPDCAQNRRALCKLLWQTVVADVAASPTRRTTGRRRRSTIPTSSTA